MDVNKLRRKQNRYRGLKTISYLLSYPLFLLLVFIGSIALFEGDVFANTRLNGVLVAVVVWAVAIVLQMVISLITKSYNGRTIMMIVVTLVMMIGGSVIFDVIATKKIDEIAKDYEKYGVEVKNYKYQTGWVITWTDRDSLTNKLVDDVNKFCLVYNIKYESSCYGEEKNPDGSKVTYNKEEDAYYSPNGMYADGYVFGFKQAVKVLLDYHESKFAIENEYVPPVEKSDGTVIEGYYKKVKDADEELQKALRAVENSAEWRQYKNSEEFQAAYGENGTANKFRMTEKKLNDLVASLQKGIEKSKLVDTLRGLPFGLGGMIEDLIKKVGLSFADVESITLDKVITLLNSDALSGLLQGLGLEGPVTVDTLLNLVENYYSYQSPTTRPKFDFIEDDNLRKYAYANYYATVHGANVGSVLVSKTEDGNIGQVTMNDGGYPNSFAYSQTELYDLQAREKVANSYYPYMIARRYALICSGISALMMVLMYYFKRREDETFDEMCETFRGGRR